MNPSNESGTDTAFQRKIKREILGKEQIFRIFCPQVFLTSLLTELKHLGITPNSTGGNFVDIKSKTRNALAFLLILKSGTNIALIIDQFQAKSTEELYRKTNRIPWDLYLPIDGSVVVKSTVKESQIRHEGRTSETVLDAITKDRSLHSSDISEVAECWTVRTEIIRNRVTLLLLLDKKPRHIRGLKIKQGLSPIRETMLSSLILGIEWPEIIPFLNDIDGDFSQQLHILDPFCGSGTILFELASHILRLPINTPALSNMKELSWFPSKSAGHELQKCLEEAEQRFNRLKKSITLQGIDIDSRQINYAEKNLSSFMNHFNDFFTVEFQKADAFLENWESAVRPEASRQYSGETLFLFSNLPYEERIKTGKPHIFEQRLFKKLKELRSSWRGLFIVARNRVKNFRDQEELVLEKQIDFNNGGIPVSALYLSPNNLSSKH